MNNVFLKKKVNVNYKRLYFSRIERKIIQYSCEFSEHYVDL